MDLDRYPFTASEDLPEFHFTSKGPNGNIKKIIRFYKMRSYGSNTYNLSLVDSSERGNLTSDVMKSNNKDTEKILATTALCIILFFKRYPFAILIASGSTASRTRLYQIGINKHWDAISQLFTVEGLLNGRWKPFQAGKNYKAFLLYKKINL
jgi:hypothetical protein